MKVDIKAEIGAIEESILHKAEQQKDLREKLELVNAEKRKAIAKLEKEIEAARAETKELIEVLYAEILQAQEDLAALKRIEDRKRREEAAVPPKKAAPAPSQPPKEKAPPAPKEAPPAPTKTARKQEKRTITEQLEMPTDKVPVDRLREAKRYVQKVVKPNGQTREELCIQIMKTLSPGRFTASFLADLIAEGEEFKKQPYERVRGTISNAMRELWLKGALEKKTFSRGGGKGGRVEYWIPGRSRSDDDADKRPVVPLRNGMETHVLDHLREVHPQAETARTLARVLKDKHPDRYGSKKIGDLAGSLTACFSKLASRKLIDRSNKSSKNKKAEVWALPTPDWKPGSKE